MAVAALGLAHMKPGKTIHTCILLAYSKSNEDSCYRANGSQHKHRNNKWRGILYCIHVDEKVGPREGRTKLSQVGSSHFTQLDSHMTTHSLQPYPSIRQAEMGSVAGASPSLVSALTPEFFEKPLNPKCCYSLVAMHSGALTFW